ncbi:MAG TPA: hypothetical protein VMB50_06005 [Myxococcales bacterium]|nr:hypothetical protein [Myxococcales bacterium]
MRWLSCCAFLPLAACASGGALPDGGGTTSQGSTSGGRSTTGGAAGASGGSGGRASTGEPGGGTTGGGSSGGGSSGGSVGDAGLQTVSSLTKDGITWTFAAPVQAGQFVNGDYYVVGPVTVSAIDPPPNDPGLDAGVAYVNGSAVDLPAADSKSPFDSRLEGNLVDWWFDPALRAYPPLSLVPGDALVSSRSLGPGFLTDGGLPNIMRSGDLSASPVASDSVLTVLAAPASPDAFRPSYCDRQQALFHANDLNRALLLSLPPPNPSAPNGTPTLATFEGYLRRPWIDLNPFLFDVPSEYMPDYGMEVALVDGYVALLLQLNFPAADKVNLTNYFVQYGIDLWGCVQIGYGWPAFGGHRSGRKLPILFAGALLGNQDMQNVSALYPNQFGEDMQTVYVNAVPDAGTTTWEGATVMYGGHYGVDADGTPVSAGLYGPYEQLQPTQWPTDPGDGNIQLGEAYRRCCTSIAWVGEALAMRLLHLESVWNYPAFFAYVDRWMYEPGDAQNVQTILSETGYDYTASWEAEGQTAGFLQGEFPQYTFVDDMWHAYRGDGGTGDFGQ